jgi:hypothetical protein
MKVNSVSLSRDSLWDRVHPLKPDAAQIPAPYVAPSPAADTSAGLPLRQLFVIHETASLLFGMT